jgi:hypothetical protein
MNIVLFIGALLAGVVLAVLGTLLRMVLSRQSGEFSLDQCLEFRMDRYRPMERLLDESDFEFLASQPGYTPSLGRRLRSERRKIFRSYLRCMKKDFDRICLAFNLVMVHSAQDRSELAGMLMKQRVRFALSMLAVQGRLVLHTIGIGTVDVRGVVAPLEAIQFQVRLLLAPPVAI